MKSLNLAIIALALDMTSSFGYQFDEFNPQQLAVDHAIKALNGHGTEHGAKITLDENEIHVRVWQDFPGRGINQKGSTIYEVEIPVTLLNSTEEPKERSFIDLACVFESPQLPVIDYGMKMIPPLVEAPIPAPTPALRNEPPRQNGTPQATPAQSAVTGETYTLTCKDVLISTDRQTLATLMALNGQKEKPGISRQLHELYKSLVQQELIFAPTPGTSISVENYGADGIDIIRLAGAEREYYIAHEDIKTNTSPTSTAVVSPTIADMSQADDDSSSDHILHRYYTSLGHVIAHAPPPDGRGGATAQEVRDAIAQQKWLNVNEARVKELLDWLNANWGNFHNNK